MGAVPKVNGKAASFWKYLTKRREKRRKNPSSSVERAAKFYEEFHWGDGPTKVVEQPIELPPDVATELGELVAVTYRTHKGGERATWEHEFGEEGGKRPRLVVDPESKRLFIVGGDYTVTDAGIEN